MVKQLLQLLLTLIVFLTGCISNAQTPNEVHMKLEPFPETNWYLHLGGYYGHMDHENNVFVNNSINLRHSVFYGMEGDENAERAISIVYKWGASKYQIQVITDSGLSDKYKMEFRNPFASAPPDPTPNEELQKYYREQRAFSAFAVVKGQPIGIRLFEQGKSEPFNELRFDDPGEPPKIWIKETVFVPKGKVNTNPLGTVLIEKNGEGYYGGIFPAPITAQSPFISYDGGATWKAWRGSGLGHNVFSPEILADCPHPIIKITAYHRMRRYVKYYTYKKGFSDEPGGPYEPITLPDDNGSAPQTAQQLLVPITNTSTNANTQKGYMSRIFGK
ncbi:MAG: hypothetical protein FWG02_10830 [Holophagaceae bacterium]|nr:hypothetical protein [Holophagaceae bacterium]